MMQVRRQALVIVALLLLVSGASALDDYACYQEIDHAACDKDVYQQDIVIHRSNGTAYNETSGGLETWHIYVGDHCQEDYDDVRFTNSSESELAYYLWPDYTNSSAKFCVRLEGADEAGTLTVWYGNSTAATTSDGDATYLLFEDYSNDLSQFNTGAKSGGKIEIDSGALKIYQNPSGAHWGGYASTKVKFTNGNGISIVFKHKKPAGYDANLRQMQSIWAVTDSATSGRNPYYYLPTTAEALIWKSPPGVSTFTESRIDISDEGTFRVNGGSWVSGITDPWGTAHPWSRVGATYNLEFLNCDYGNYPCYFDDIRVRAYSAAPPAATDFSGEQENPGPPSVGFTATPTVGLAPLTVQFNDTSLRSPTSWTWDFGDGSTSTDQNPEHTYTAAGTYSVNLTATNEYGTGYKLKPDHITVYDPVTAQFTADVTYGALPLTVRFTDASSGSPTSWAWDFGDGNTSTDQNPEHTYTSTGTYTVKLIASHPYDSDEETKDDYITVVTLQPFPGCSSNPTDPDSDGLYEDINGNGRWDFQDLVLFFQHLTWCNANQPITLFDWNSNGRCDFDDVFRLWSNGGMI
ncbi:MAG: PKD domain protein [Euryarchaeota archaeon ADurb.Bin009]|nr:MAG: PKD domain protein [Euryarchaeota archaeon ADurb.Bin009]